MRAMAGLDVSVEGSASDLGPALDPPTQLQPESRFLNRELSALDYFAACSRSPRTRPSRSSSG